MRKRIGILAFLVILVIVLHLSSGFIHQKAEEWLKGRLIAVLPPGSSIGDIEWSMLSSLKVDSLVIKEIGSLKDAEILYTPIGILRRRIQSVSLNSPRFNLILSSSTEGGEKKIPGLFFIESFSVTNGSIEWNGKELLLSGEGRLFSTGEEIVLDIFKMGGVFKDSVDFNMHNGRLNITKSMTGIEISTLRVGKSVVRITGNFEERIEGEGILYLEDLTPLWDIEGEGKIEFLFVRDSIWHFKGKSGIILLEEININPLSFWGTGDSVRIEGNSFGGHLMIRDGIRGIFHLRNLNMKAFKEVLPDSKLNGIVDFTYDGNDNVLIESSISGILMDMHISDLDLKVEKRGNRLFFDHITGYFNGGKISFKGEYDTLITGDFLIDNLEISPLLKYFGIEGGGIFSIDLNVRDRVYGVFSMDSLRYGPFFFRLVNGTISLSQSRDGFPGEITYVLQDICFNARNIFGLGEGKLKGTEKDYTLDGLFKMGDKRLEYSLFYRNDSLLVKDLKLTHASGGLLLKAPFFIVWDGGFRTGEVRFEGGKHEEVRMWLKKNEKGLAGRVGISRVKLSLIKSFYTLPEALSGLLNGSIILKGDSASPLVTFKGDGLFKWMGMKIGDSLSFDIEYQEKSLLLKEIRLFEGEISSRFSGSVDFEKTSLDMKVALNEAGNWILYPLYEYLDAKNVVVNGDLMIKGSFSAPLVFGRVKVVKGNLLLVKQGIEIESLSADIQCEGDKAFLKASKIFLEEGLIDAKGVFNIGEKGYSVKVKMKDTPINWQYVNAIIDGDLTISKDEKGVGIEGGIVLDGATIMVPFSRKEEGGARPSNLYLDISIDALSGNVWLRNDMADMELIGEIGVKYDAGPLFLTGNLSVKQGNFYYLYRSFDVVKGEFKFRNIPELNPDIDIKAKTIINSTDTVFLGVFGTMRMPEFDLYSKPPRPITDIMALLNLNLSWEDLSSLKAIEESVAETAFNYWIRQTFSRRFKEELGIDVMQMEEESGHYEFVLGKYITRSLFVKARTNMSTYGLSEIQAEYRLGRWGSIVAENNFSGQTRLFFNMRWRY